MADGQPWDQLSSNMQKTILYSHILESVTNNLGMSMQDTTALRMAVFTASLYDVRMALGQAFLPILYSVLPILTTLMNWLYKALQVVAAFTKALFGGFNYKAQAKGANAVTAATQKQAGAVGDLGKAADKTAKKQKKAAKEAKGGVAAFDEVNTLADKADAAGAGAGAGGGGGGGGGGVAAPDMPTLPTPDASGFMEGVDKMVAYFQEKLKPIKDMAKTVWDYISSYFQVKGAQIVGFWNQYGSQIMKALSNVWNFIKPIIMFVVKFVWESVKGLIDGVIKFFEGLIKFFTGVFTGDWKLAWDGLKDIFFGALQAIWNFMNLSFIGGIKKLLLSFAKDGIGIVLTFVKGWKDLFAKNFTDILKGFTNMIKNVKLFFTDWYKWMESTGLKTAHALGDAWLYLTKIPSRIINVFKSVFGGLLNWMVRYVINPVVNKFESIKHAFDHGIGSGFRAVVNNVRGPINTMIGAFNGVKNALHLPIKNVPTIPYLAKGGIATAATLAMVGEGGEDEAIAPISKLQGYISDAVIAAMRAIGPTGGGATGDIILNLDGRTFARIIKPHMDKEFKRIGTNIRLNPI